MRHVFVALVVCGLSFAFPAGAVERRVPEEFPTIQQALEAAAAGDEIKVAAGQYEGPLTFKDGITLTGACMDQVLVRCSAEAGPVLAVRNCAAGRIRGFTFEQTPRQTPLDQNPQDQMKAVCLIEASTVEVAECEARGGESFGFELRGQGASVVTSCVARKNTRSGILVIGPDASPRLVKNVCSENARSGIFVWENCAPVLEENVCRNNTFCGVYALGPGAKPSLLRNECSENNRHGIELDTNTSGNLEGNRSTNNKGSGLYVHGSGAEVKVSGNVFSRNEHAGLWATDENNVYGKGNDFTGNREINGCEVRLLFLGDDFGGLEKLAERLRNEKARFDEGGWQLHEFYGGLTSHCRYEGKEQETDFLKHMDKWKAAYPDSITWRVALAKGCAGFAWRARGSGWAREVSPEGWERFRSYMKQAWNVLEDAKRLNPVDPEYYAVRVAIAFESGQASASKSSAWSVTTIGMLFNTLFGAKDTVRFLFEEGQKVEPLYLPLYTERMRSLQSRWSGRPASATAALVNESADKTRSLCGDALFAQLVCQTYEFESDGRLLEEYSYDWGRLEQGFQDMKKQFPRSLYYDNYHCLLACLYGKREVARPLFDAVGADWSAKVWQSEGQFAAWRRWAEGKAAVPKRSDLEQAVRDGETERVRELLDNGADAKEVSLDGDSLLFLALQHGSPEMAKCLVEKGADANRVGVGGRTPLRYAVDLTSDEYLRVLLDCKADPNVVGPDGWTPLALAISREKADRAMLLLDHGADPNTALSDGTTPLMLASMKGQANVAEALLRHGANPNVLHRESNLSPLMFACRGKHAGVCALLLDKGADPNLPRPNGAVALFDAAEMAGSLEMVKQLIAKGADVNARTKGGWNVFHAAVRGNAKDVLEYCLELNPDGVKAVTNAGKTLLHEAAQKGNVAIVKLLLEKNVIDVNAVDGGDSRTALANALDAKSTEIADLLRAKGAKE